MDLLLHAPTAASNLSAYYESAFRNATELFVVSAYRRYPLGFRIVTKLGLPKGFA